MLLEVVQFEPQGPQGRFLGGHHGDTSSVDIMILIDCLSIDSFLCHPLPDLVIECHTLFSSRPREQTERQELLPVCKAVCACPVFSNHKECI